MASIALNDRRRDVYAADVRAGYTGTFDEWISKRAIEKRIAIERRMCRAAVKGLLTAGYFVTVNDGEEDTVKRSRSLAQIMAALMTTDEDWLKAYPPPGSMDLRYGWVRLIYGNDGWDVIADYTVNLEPALATASKLSDRISEQLG